MDISNVATNSRAYDTNLGLSNKEIQEKLAKLNKGTIFFREAMAYGLEAHNFNYDISLRTTTRGKKGKGKDGETTSDKTLTGNLFVTTGGIPITATNKLHAALGLEEAEDADSFTSSINSTQLHLVVKVGKQFHDARKELLKPDEQPD